MKRHLALIGSLIIGGGLALLAGATGCAGGRRDPVLLLVTLDTLRADRVGCYGYAAAATPVMDRLAREGAAFFSVSTVTPLTLPAHASILTGRYPAATGVRNNGTFLLPPEEETLAEVFKKRGFKTAAFVASFVLKSSFNLSQGFDTYDEKFDLKRQGGPRVERRAESVNRSVLEWLDHAGKGPLFLWVHYFDAHAPYEPPPPFDQRFASSPYDGEVANMDAALGELLAALESRRGRKNLSVIVVGDHGEALWEHGESTHGLFVYEVCVHVPLILWAPGRVPAGVAVREPVSVVDVFDTALALAGGRPEAGSQRHGIDLLPLVRGEGASRPLPVIFESFLPRLEYGWSEFRGVREGPLKLISAPRPELFDLSSDANEARDLAGARPQDVSRLRSEMERAYTSVSSSARPAQPNPLDEDSRERLRALGYVAGGPPPAPPVPAGGSQAEQAAPLPDPKDRIGIYNKIKAAAAAAEQSPEALPSAISTLREVLREDPSSIAARWRLSEALLAAGQPGEVVSLLSAHADGAAGYEWAPWLLAKAHRDLGHREEALALFREGMRRSPGDRAVELVHLLREMGRIQESLAEAEKAIAMFPGDAILLALAGSNYKDLGRMREAEEMFRRGAASSPGQAAAALPLAELMLDQGKSAEAEAVLRRFLEEEPDDAQGRALLGLALMNRLKLDAAAEQLRRARSLDPSNPSALGYLALCLMDSGHLEEAEGCVVELLRLQPSSPHSHRALGLLREKQGRTAEAVAAFRQALSLNPADAASRRALDRLTTH